MTAVAPAVAGVDPELPRLSAGIDPEFVRALFTTRLPAGGPPSTSVLGGERMHTDYRPGQRCRISYRLRLGAPDIEPWSSFGQVLVDRQGLDLRWYDDDPELPTLRVAISPTRMRQRLDGCAGERAPAWTVSPVRYRAGARCVLRYQAAGSERVLFGKLYRHDAERHARAQTALAETLQHERAGGPRPRVPAVVGYDGELGLVLHAPVPGRTVRAIAFDPSVGAATRLRALCDTGEQLAGLHASAGIAGPVRLLADDVAELRGYLAVVGHADRRLGERLARLIDITDGLPEGPVDLAPAHGALRTDQVVLGPDGIVLLDLDGLGWAEPARDVGNLLGYLAWRALRRPAERAFLAAAGQAFLDGYRAGAPGLDEARLRGYRAATLMKIAGRRFRSLQFDEWPLVPALLDAAADLLPAPRPRRAASTAVASAGQPARTTTARRPGRLVEAPQPARLAEARQPARMTAELAALPWGVDAHPVRVGSAELLAHRADRTSVLRYHLLDGSGHRRAVLGKLYPDRGVALRTHDIHATLHAALGGGALAEPLGVLPTLPILVLRPVEGRTLDQIGSAADAAAAVGSAACWLAGLHGSTAVLGRGLDLQDEQRNVAAWARVVRDGLPELAGPADALGTGLAAALGTLPPRRDVPIHKDFHYQHVLVGTRTAVIDLDEARMGDPALDVAHFCGYLELLAVRRAAPATLGAIFRRRYTELSCRPLDTAYPVFSAWTCLKIAKQLTTGRGPHPRPTGVGRLSQARHVLGRGLEWLGR